MRDYPTVVAGPATDESEKASREHRYREDRTRQIVIEELHRQMGSVTHNHGCVCPVGAEQTCNGPLCPRKPIGPAA
jgi:hypothetical protein